MDQENKPIKRKERRTSILKPVPVDREPMQVRRLIDCGILLSNLTTLLRISTTVGNWK